LDDENKGPTTGTLLTMVTTFVTFYETAFFFLRVFLIFFGTTIDLHNNVQRAQYH